MNKFVIHDTIWEWQGGQSSWHFIRVGEKDSKRIKENQSKLKRRGFGSVRVKATLGKTTWTTSIFPTKEGPYILPIKASVRSKEMAQDGDTVKIHIELI